ncbi:holin family protein [Maribellus sediminis]|uniref:holin family protein n=1 Tax=Maribellus sediminis TaxID=2696285 RepID=UPI00142FF393|nr:holin family protein [Maribellus sediminis]
MELFKKLFSKGITDVVDSVSNVIDRFTLSKEEKQEFKLEMQSRMMQLESELEETYRKELDARQEIIKAELTQGDNYTKRARPTIVYAGMLFIFLVYVIVPVIAYISGADKMPDIQLPNEFWWAWGTVVGVYGVGRSAEKMGITNKLTNYMTGSGANKVPTTINKAEG